MQRVHGVNRRTRSRATTRPRFLLVLGSPCTTASILPRRRRHPAWRKTPLLMSWRPICEMGPLSGLLACWPSLSSFRGGGLMGGCECCQRINVSRRPRKYPTEICSPACLHDEQGRLLGSALRHVLHRDYSPEPGHSWAIAAVLVQSQG